MRINTSVKIHELHGPRLPYNPKLAEIRENEYAYLTADGIAVPDGEGILYWVDSIITTDGGDALVYDNNAASGKILAGAYAAKKPYGVKSEWNPPKNYKNGIFVDLTNAVVEVCYKPIARNLRCRVSPVPASLKNLICRVTTVKVYWGLTKNLVSRTTVRRQGTKSLTSRITVRPMVATRALVSRVTIRKEASKNLVCHLYADRTE